MSFAKPDGPIAADTQNAAREIYEHALAAAGAHRTVILQVRAEELARHVLRTAARKPGVATPGHAAVVWLRQRLREDDDRVRRGAVAALALTLPRRTAGLPAALRDAHADAQARLTRSLRSDRPYRDAAFSKDVALACGLATPVGPFNLYAPAADVSDGAPLRARRLAGASLRHLLQFGGREAHAFVTAAGLKPWAELHLDLRALEAFNASGVTAAYQLAANLMRARPDLAGLYGASWLYDPRLAVVSPELSFIRRTAEDGGARIVRLRADPAQTDFAIARSPLRRALMEAGRYRPVCYAVYWTAAELIAWSDQAGAKGLSRLKVVRK